MTTVANFNIGRLSCACRELTSEDLIKYSQKNAFGKVWARICLFFTGKGIYSNESARKLLEQNIHGDELLKAHPMLKNLLYIQKVAKDQLNASSQTSATLKEKTFTHQKENSINFLSDTINKEPLNSKEKQVEIRVEQPVPTISQSQASIEIKEKPPTNLSLNKTWLNSIKNNPSLKIVKDNTYLWFSAAKSQKNVDIPDTVIQALPPANYYCIFTASSRTELDQNDFKSFVESFKDNGLPIVILSYRYGAHAPKLKLKVPPYPLINLNYEGGTILETTTNQQAISKLKEKLKSNLSL